MLDNWQSVGVSCKCVALSVLLFVWIVILSLGRGCTGRECRCFLEEPAKHFLAERVFRVVLFAVLLRRVRREEEGRVVALVRRCEGGSALIAVLCLFR